MLTDVLTLIKDTCIKFIFDKSACLFPELSIFVLKGYPIIFLVVTMSSLCAIASATIMAIFVCHKFKH